jgi:hypothetical protein
MPRNRIVVLNRTSRTNLVQDIVTTLQIQPKKPYLMLRDSANPSIDIYGIWFQDESELKLVTHALSRLMKGLRRQVDEADAAATAGTTATSGAAAGRALLSMLQHASPPAAATKVPAAAGQAARPPQEGGLAPAAAALFSSYAASRAGVSAGVAVGPPPPHTTGAAMPVVRVAPAAPVSAAGVSPLILSRQQLQAVLLDLLGVSFELLACLVL